MGKFYCICDMDCTISGVDFYKDTLYCIDENYILGSFYEVWSMNNDLIGYINPYELDCYFTTVLFIINDVDRMFNKIMDNGISLY